MATEEDFVEVTTGGGTKRHWSLLPVKRGLRPLCGSSPVAIDEDALNVRRPRRRRRLLVELPGCVQCEKSLRRRIEDDDLA